MCRAGAAALARASRAAGPRRGRSRVVCGAGNNAGDGLVVARLAHAAGRAVSVLLVVPPERVQRRRGASGRLRAAQPGCRSRRSTPARSASADVIVDALLGTGLARAVAGDFRAAIDAVNAAGRARARARRSERARRRYGLAESRGGSRSGDRDVPRLEAGLVPRRRARPLRRARVRGSRAAARARRRSCAAPLKRLVLDGARARVAAAATQCAQRLVRAVVARRRRTRDAGSDPAGGRGRAARRRRTRLCRDASRQRRERAGRSA